MIFNGLQIALAKECHGKGISTIISIILKEMIKMARDNGIMISSRWLSRSDPDLKVNIILPFDPWLRVYARVGGKNIMPCQEASISLGL